MREGDPLFPVYPFCAFSTMSHRQTIFISFFQMSQGTRHEVLIKIVNGGEEVRSEVGRAEKGRVLRKRGPEFHPHCLGQAPGGGARGETTESPDGLGNQRAGHLGPPCWVERTFDSLMVSFDSGWY